MMELIFERPLFAEWIGTGMRARCITATILTAIQHLWPEPLIYLWLMSMKAIQISFTCESFASYILYST